MRTTGTTATSSAVLRVFTFLALALLVVVPAVGAGCAEETSTTTSQVTPTSAATTSSLAQTTTTTSAIPGTVPSLPAGEPLTLEHVRNAEITGLFDQTIMSFRLVDGSYKGPRSENDPSTVNVTVSEVVAFGDLNGDEVDDAAIAMTLDKDAGALLYIVALLSEAGEPASAGSHFVGSGSRLEDLSIIDGEILVAATVPGPEDPTGEPVVPITATLRLPLVEGTNWALLHTSQTSETPGGDVRKITITYPDLGPAVSSVALIKGNVTIAPFENNLVYTVYDAEMTERAQGPVPVEAPDFGAPGIFELTLGLLDLGCTGRVFVTISDLSAADGSILAMDSIELEVFAPG